MAVNGVWDLPSVTLVKVLRASWLRTKAFLSSELDPRWHRWVFDSLLKPSQDELSPVWQWLTSEGVELGGASGWMYYFRISYLPSSSSEAGTRAPWQELV